MAAITTRQTTSAVAGVTNNNNPLSNAQLDANFINLNADIATKVSITGATMTGSLLTDIGGGATSSTKHIDLINGTGYDLFMLPRGGAGSYNPLVAAGDAIIGFSAGAVDTGALTIGAWSNSAIGLRLARTGATTLNTLYGSSQLQDNVGFVLNGNYTDGRYSHRFRKFDDGGGVPLYIQSTMGTAGTWTNLVKFGPNTADQNAFTVFGNSRTEGTLTVTGNVGIGPSTPQYKLDVNNSGTGFQASFGSTFSTGSWSGIHFGYSEAANQLYRKSAIVFERSDSAIGDARGKIHILNAEAGTASATLADARVTVLSNGNVGIGATSPGYKLEVNGSFAATTKSFVIPHPTVPGKKLRYGSLEGPENGVYARGKLIGNNRIELPEYWTKLVDPDSITVNLTPIGGHQNLYVEEVRNNVVVIKNANLLLKEINCYYTVFAERADVEKLEVECD